MNTIQQNEIPTRTLAQIDQEFEQLGCLGHGGTASVLLARKRSSGRRVAIKVMSMDSSDQHDVRDFMREVHAVTKLNNRTNNDKQDSRDLAIVFFEEWFVGGNFGCIVMSYMNGGTLADWIVSRSTSSSEPFTERRIGWYALQLSEALAYAHERGVAHHDVKSGNVLIDLSQGGKLLLTDFGSAVAPGEDSVGFSPIYASPELIQAQANDDYSGLEADKVDAFGLGCILFELLCCQKLVDLTGDQTLAEYITENGVEAALELPCVRLPWLSAQDESETAAPCSSQVIGYSNALQGLVKTLLEALPASRWTPSELQKPLRNDLLSPLVANHVVAAQPPIPGAPVTIDNVQLGMFIQRGQDWEEGDSDGGLGSIGVIINLDSDALYTQVAWPLRTSQASSLESTCCRIGASNKFEIQVGPTPMIDFVTAGTGEPMGNGILKSSDASNYSVGQLVNDKCMVVGVRDDLVLVAPLEQINIPTIPATPIQPQMVPRLLPQEPKDKPDNWQPNDTSVLVEVMDLDEKTEVIDLFYSNRGGMDIQAYEITSIKRVQSIELWKVYAESREHVAAENWGVANERRMFHGTRTFSPESLLCNHPSEFYQKCSYGGVDLDSREIQFSSRASWGDENGHRTSNGERQIVLSRVALGRLRQLNIDQPQSPEVIFHSEPKPSDLNGSQIKVAAIRNPYQAVPEYIITYKPLQGPSRRIVSVRRPQAANNRSSRGSTTSRHHESVRSIGATNGIRSQYGVVGLQITGQGRTFAVTRRDSSTGTPKEVALQESRKEQSKSSSTKMCVVCLSKPVCRILLPCGHPCLCEICSTEQGLAKLKRKCPECRSTIREAATIYGRVVDD